MFQIALQIIAVIIVAGVIAWLLDLLLPIDQKYKTAINGVLAILVVLYILSALLGFSIPLRFR